MRKKSNEIAVKLLKIHNNFYINAPALSTVLAESHIIM